MLKLQCKTTFNSVFVDKKNHQNRTRSGKIVVYMKYIVTRGSGEPVSLT
jgi:hypothetical protein